jgi:hypothetical protein
MTTIRKIPTSKIDGNSANNTSTNETRPFGEVGVYINTDVAGNGADRLELLMFDGVRTNLRSKVLAKGTFYGGDADSSDIGDGIEHLDTIKLIPDAELYYNDSDYGNDQYIVIDPTLENHIHIRAGGAIDASTALLILGGEENHVTVSDYADEVTIRTNDTHIWTFGIDGDLTLPVGGEIKTEAGTGDVVVEANDGTARTWTFGGDGALTLPDDSVIASYKPVTVIAQTTTAQTITDSASAAFIQFVETVDTANAYSTGTFTAPYTGYYQVNMSVYFSTNVTISGGGFFLIDTNLDFNKQVKIVNGSWEGRDLHYSTVIPATAGDAIRIAIRQVSGSDIEISSGSRLTIHRVSIS